MKKTFLTVGLFVALYGFTRAQSVTPDVITTAGDYYSNAAGSISWTLGEPMGETYSVTNNILTQGFQQPWDFGTDVSGPSPVQADVYPNPTSDVVNLQFAGNASGQYVIEVFNTLGQQLSATQFAAGPSARTSVSLADFSNGIYFITVRKTDGTETSTFKINKTS